MQLIFFLGHEKSLRGHLPPWTHVLGATGGEGTCFVGRGDAFRIGLNPASHCSAPLNLYRSPARRPARRPPAALPARLPFSPHRMVSNLKVWAPPPRA